MDFLLKNEKQKGLELCGSLFVDYVSGLLEKLILLLFPICGKSKKGDLFDFQDIL